MKDRDPSTYLRGEPYYSAIELRTENFNSACLPLIQTFSSIAHTKRKLYQDSLERLPGGLVSSLAWTFFNRSQTARNYNAIFAMPDLGLISGPYFDTIKEKGYHSKYSADYNHLCGDYW